MIIPVVCDQCKRTIKAKETLAGKRVKCPGCGAVVMVHRVPADAPAAAAPRAALTPKLNRAGTRYLPFVIVAVGALSAIALLAYFLGRRNGDGSPQATTGAIQDTDLQQLVGRWVIVDPPSDARYYPREVDIDTVSPVGSVAGSAAMREGDNTVVTGDIKLEKRRDIPRQMSKREIDAALAVSATLPFEEQWQLQIRGRRTSLAYAVMLKQDKNTLELLDTSNRIAYAFQRRDKNAKNAATLDDWRTPKMKQDEWVGLGPWGFAVLAVDSKDRIQYGNYELKVDKDHQIVEVALKCRVERFYSADEEKFMIEKGYGTKSGFDELRAKNILVLTNRRFGLQYQPGGEWAPGQWLDAEFAGMTAEGAHTELEAVLDSRNWRAEIPINAEIRLQVAFVVERGGKNFEFIFTPLAHLLPRHGARTFDF